MWLNISRRHIYDGLCPDPDLYAVVPDELVNIILNYLLDADDHIFLICFDVLMRFDCPTKLAFY